VAVLLLGICDRGAQRVFELAGELADGERDLPFADVQVRTRGPVVAEDVVGLRELLLTTAADMDRQERKPPERAEPFVVDDARLAASHRCETAQSQSYETVGVSSM